MATRIDESTRYAGDEASARSYAARGAAADSRLHGLDTIGAVLALVMILGPLMMGAFFR